MMADILWGLFYSVLVVWMCMYMCVCVYVRASAPPCVFENISEYPIVLN